MIRFLVLGLLLWPLAGIAAEADSELLSLKPPVSPAELEARRASALNARAQAEAKVGASYVAEIERLVAVALHPNTDADFAPDRQHTARTHRAACAAGEQAACATLGSFYMTGDGTLIDRPLAKALFYQACAAGERDGCFALASDLWSHEMREEAANWPHAAWFREACAQDDPAACYQIGTLHLFGGDGVAEDRALAETLLRKSCELGEPGACTLVTDAKARLDPLLDRCDAGNGAACNAAARMLQDTDPDRATALFERACLIGRAGCSAAMKRLPAERATALARAHCEAGKESACIDLAVRYETGEGVKKDEAKAADLYRAHCFEAYVQQAPCAARFAMLMEAGVLLTADHSQDLPAALRDQARTAMAACRMGEAEACLHFAKMTQSVEGPLQAQSLVAFTQACRLEEAKCLESAPRTHGQVAGPQLQALCDDGNAEACLRDILTSPDRDDERDSVALIEGLCADGLDSACVVVAQGATAGRLWRFPVARDPARAQSLFEAACANGNPEACHHLALSRDLETERPQITAEIERLCDQDFAAACWWLAGQIAYGDDGPRDLATAQVYALRTCELGGGCSYAAAFGRAIERQAVATKAGDLAAATEDWTAHFQPQFRGQYRRTARGCQAGVPQDCVALGHLHWASPSETYLDGDAERDWSRALYLAACEAGLGEGCYAYASSYDGVGEETRADISLAYFGQACEMGVGAGCHQAGFLHKLGQGVPEDESMAAMFYLKGCSLGDALACESLVGLYDVAEGLRPALVSLACVMGASLGCEFAEETYRRGQGVTKNRQMARLFRQYRCEDGDPGAC